MVVTTVERSEALTTLVSGLSLASHVEFLAAAYDVAVLAKQLDCRNDLHFSGLCKNA